MMISGIHLVRFRFGSVRQKKSGSVRWFGKNLGSVGHYPVKIEIFDKNATKNFTPKLQFDQKNRPQKWFSLTLSWMEVLICDEGDLSFTVLV